MFSDEINPADDIILSARNISKRFEIYAQPRHRLQQMLFGRWKTYYREFWALQDINFEVRRGECVGVIGRNGAGKSTLLQILTGTLAPTTGSVCIKGRVAALLELGSGFNPEFSGRDNVYMNASILGLTQQEIDAKYQEIVDFADIGDFIDQPVKTYSSGMMVRLAFAVQVAVEPDILIVDEALAVGDAAFIRKCFAYMEMLISRGTTLFLVTHDTETVKRMCKRAIFLKDHRCEFDGDSLEAVNRYMKYLFPADTEAAVPAAEEKAAAAVPGSSELNCACHCVPEEGKNSYGTGGGKLSWINIYGVNETHLLPVSGKIKIEVQCSWDQEYVRKKIAQEQLAPNIILGYAIANEKNICLFGTNTLVRGITIDPFAHSEMNVSYDLEIPVLTAGNYFLVIALCLGNENSSIDLIWQDFAVPLYSANSFARGGFIDIPTKVDVQFNNGR